MSSNRGRRSISQRIILSERQSEKPVEELAELDIYKTQSITDDDFCIGLTARFGSMPISCENWAYSVEASFKEAYVQLHPVNCSISNDGRYGDQARPSEATSDKSMKLATTEKGGISGKAELGIGISSSGLKAPSLGGLLSAKKSKEFSSSSVQTQKIKETTNSITAMAGRKWRFADLVSINLFGKYEPLEHLCKVTVGQGSNSGNVEARLFFYPKDLEIAVHEVDQSLAGRLLKDKPNNIAVAKALLAKHLRELNPSDKKHADGRIAVGSSVIDYKINEDEN